MPAPGRTERTKMPVAALTFELRFDISVLAGVLLLVVRLELVERLQVLQAERAQEPFPHLRRIPEGRRVAGRHGAGRWRAAIALRAQQQRRGRAGRGPPAGPKRGVGIVLRGFLEDTRAAASGGRTS